MLALVGVGLAVGGQLGLPANAQEIRGAEADQQNVADDRQVWRPFPPRNPDGQLARPDWQIGGAEEAGRIGTEVQEGRDVSEALDDAIEQDQAAIQSSQAIEAELEAALRNEPFSFDDDTGASRARNALQGTEAFDPLGIRAGTFIVRPSIELRGGADFEEDPDFTAEFYRIQPELGFESDWVRHRLEGRIGWREQRYPDDEARNETRIDADLRLRLDVTQRTEFDAALSYSRDETGDADDEAPANAAGDTEVTEADVDLALRHEFGRLTGTLRGSLSDTEFDDTPLIGGGSASSSVRDFQEREVGLRLDYAATDRNGVFAELSANEREFDAGVNADGRSLGSEGLRALAGVQFDNGGTLRGDLGLGVQVQDPNDPALETVHAFVIEGSALWQPSALTSFSLEADTTVDDSTTTGEAPDATYSLRAGVAHALRRNLILDGGVGYAFDDDSSSLTFDAGFEYRIRRYIALVGDVSHTVSEVDGDDDAETTVSVGVRLER
ncbi:MAG: outer membrane beta-barrel protein [Pseudomonadota bacterium]